MRQEFHAEQINGTRVWQQLYSGWTTITANIWLPSLSELVGIDSNQYDGTRGTYVSAMQNVPDASTVGNNSVDKNGGSQWEWLIPFNPSGGAAEIWRLCGSTTAWLHTPDKANATSSWAVTDQSKISWNRMVTRSFAVHPVVGASSISFASP